MATTTLGTTANNSLPYSIAFEPGYGSGMSAADIATIANHIIDDRGNGGAIYPQAFSSNGLLYVPNRGVLVMQPGDVVGVDNTGWPILVSKKSIASGSTIWVT